MCLGKYVSWLPIRKIVAIHILCDIQWYLHTEMKLRASLVAETKEVLNHYLVLFHLRHMLFWKASVFNTAMQHWCNEELWLTWSITQWPSFDAFSAAISATASCPWPNGTLWSSPESMVNSNLFPKQNNILYYLEPHNEVFKQACVLHTVFKCHHIAWVTTVKNPALRNTVPTHQLS